MAVAEVATATRTRKIVSITNSLLIIILIDHSRNIYNLLLLYWRVTIRKLKLRTNILREQSSR